VQKAISTLESLLSAVRSRAPVPRKAEALTDLAIMNLASKPGHPCTFLHKNRRQPKSFLACVLRVSAPYRENQNRPRIK